MVVTIEGKEHRQGVSKAGRQYDFVSVHFLAKQRGVEGLAAVSKIIDPSLIPYENIIVGQHYDVEIDLSGNICSICVAKA